MASGSRCRSTCWTTDQAEKPWQDAPQKRQRSRRKNEAAVAKAAAAEAAPVSVPGAATEAVQAAGSSGPDAQAILQQGSSSAPAGGNGIQKPSGLAGGFSPRRGEGIPAEFHPQWGGGDRSLGPQPLADDGGSSPKSPVAFAAFAG